jgi:hypothetical protein
MRLYEEEAEGGIGLGLIGFHREESRAHTGIGMGLIGFHQEESRAQTGIGMGLIGFHQENDRIFQFPSADHQTKQVTCQNGVVWSSFLPLRDKLLFENNIKPLSGAALEPGAMATFF